MIRMKAKSVLLSIMLVVACFVFFACKEDTKVQVDNISFTEQSISLLVGEEYSPTIKMLPSYATNRGYTLISNDTTALKVEGGTITALKASLDVKLKVISNDNKNANDVISVNIYEEATQLDIPTGLNFDGNKFTFVGKDNANAYVLKVGSNEINIGNNTEYFFDTLVSKIDDVYNKVINCSVKAIGDGKIFKDSQYSQQISFVKLSQVENAYVENETLYFTGIANVASYNVKVLIDGKVLQSQVVNNASFASQQLSLDLSDLTDSINGAEYTLSITPNSENYNSLEEIDVFKGAKLELDYAVLGKVTNLTINNSVVSWDFVKNAQTYTLELYKDNNLLQQYSNIAHNYIKIEHEDEGEYYCKIIANSNKANTTAGKIYSNPLYFNILPAPKVVAENNTLTWNNVANADGYLVTIKNDQGVTIINKGFALSNTYDVSDFSAGTYYIEIIACGNGENGQTELAILSSKTSTQLSWTVLDSLQVKIENKQLKWQDLDPSSLNKYRITFDNVDVVVTVNDYDNDYKYDAITNTFSYNLSNHTFSAGTYKVAVTSLGDKNVFDAKETATPLTKLSNSSIVSLINKQFTINPVDNASSYNIEIYKSSDMENSIMLLENEISNYTFDLNADVLGAGNYVAKVFTYGNNGNVFDADNSNDGTTIKFEKLHIPSIYVDNENLKLIVDKNGKISNAEAYKIFENSVDKALEDNEYELQWLTAGDYIYKAQAIGNGTNILDSDKTAVKNQVKIKKLATPNVSFNKESLMFTISCTDDKYVGDYVFSINEQNVPVSKLNKLADCQSIIINAGSYNVRLHAEPEAASDEYALIIASAINTHTVSKLNGLCELQISNGKLLVSPKPQLSGSGYDLSLCIENGANDIILDGFKHTGTNFEKSLQDVEYNVISEINALMNGSGEYSVYTTISQNDKDVVTSSKTESANKLKVLDKVSTIIKNGQTIEFNIVENATNYISVVEVEGKEYYIDIANKYTTQTNNIVSMQDLLQLMDVLNVPYLEQTPYSISFVAVSSENCTLANKGTYKYTFKYLKAPTLSVIEQEGNTKLLAIDNNDDKTSKYYMVISQDMVVCETSILKSVTQSTLVNMDELDQLVAGEVKADIYAMTNSGDYFNSKHSILNMIKMDVPSITISNGMLEWNVVDNAKQYNLTYSNITSSGTIVLQQGAENFTIQGNKCIYNFDSLENGVSSLYLQVDSQVQSGGTYYLNSNDGKLFEDVYKLSALPIKIVDGQVYTEIRNSELDYIKQVEIKVNNKFIDIDIRKEQEGIILTNSVDKLGITIIPELLFTYGETELLLETLSMKVYSNNGTTLNSSISQKDIYGLLSPINLNITTSKNADENDVINEVLEKITWSNPIANGNHVVKYEIIINYNEVDYIINRSDCSLMMPTFYDEDDDRVKDESEIEFGPGVYTIKVRALTDNQENIVNSKYCDSITVTVLATPTGLSVKNGNIIWTNDASAGYYLLKVYLLDGGNQTLLASSNASLNEFDLTTLNPFKTGVYGISVQAMHDNSRILASKESEIFQVIRLPQVESYYIKNGELYIRMHSFYSMAEVCLTDKSTGRTMYTFNIINESSNDNVINYIKNNLCTTWASSQVLKTYEDDNYFIDVKYEVNGDSTLRTALAQDYSMSVKLYGNTISEGVLPEGMSVGAIISGHTSEDVVNRYYEQDNSVTDKNVVEKLITPIINISETERGVVLVNSPKGLSYSLNYYINGENSLQGVHLYEVNILTNASHTLYVAEIVNESKFLASLNVVGSELIQDNTDRNNLLHFEYNDITFNVINANNDGYIPFNFNTNHYYYYTIDGEYKYIDLTVGGSFVTSVRFMGDDSIFVNSNVTDSVTIKRYNVLNLNIENGVLTWLNQATSDDHPIYVITLTNENETYNVVLYNPEIEYEEGKKYNEEYLLTCLESGKTYIFDTISYVLNEDVKDAVITYSGLADIINKTRIDNSSELVGLGGTFQANIKAHYTDSTSMDVILAQSGESKTVSILPQSSINVVDGTLTWNMSYVTSTGGKEYISNYLLQVFNGDNKLYQIILTSGDYNVADYVATYQLPRVLNNGADGDFNIQPNSSYIFKLMTLGSSGKTYINSINSETDSITILPDLQDVKMVNGVLTWANTTTHSVEVYVTYTIGGTTVTFITLETDGVFDLPAYYTDTKGTLRELVAGYDYHIKVRLKGGSSTLNGFFSKEIIAQRLSTVSSDSIVTNNGVLTWKADALEGVKYTIIYTLADNTTGETAMLDTNSFDFTGFTAGDIKVKVIVHHNDHFKAFESVDATTVFKLSIPTNIDYNKGTAVISWDKILGSDGNPVDTYMVRLQQEGLEVVEYKCSTNEWHITGVLSTSFSVAVKAIDESATGYVLNSDYSSCRTMILPNHVDTTTFEFDKELQAFKWKAIVGEQEGDKYYIGYNYYDTILSSGSSVQPTQVDYIQVTESQKVGNETYYYFYPSMMGSYRLIYVQVVRAGSLSSQQTYCMKNETEYYELDLDLFTSGDGTTKKPYVISNERHLRNIKYFLDANYELDTNIVLTSNEAITNSTQVFTGTINGNGYYISGVANVNIGMFSETGYVGLFSKVKGATFANITLSNFSLNGYLNSATLYMGILVGCAEEKIDSEGKIITSKFNNITITSSTINLVKNSEIGYTNNSVDMYIGVIVGYALNCEFTNCIINLGSGQANITADIEGNSQTKLVIGGVVGFADSCTLTSNTSNEGNAFILSTILTVTGGTPIQYIGALIGEAGSSEVDTNNNSCMYAEVTSQGLTSKNTLIGYQN